MNPRRAGRSRTDGYVDVPTTGELIVEDAVLSADEADSHKMSLPPRYRFRDLLLGDFAFTDDGQR